MPTRTEVVSEALDRHTGEQFKRKIIAEETGMPPIQVTNIVNIYLNHRLEKLIGDKGQKIIKILPSDGLPDPVSNAKVKIIPEEQIIKNCLTHGSVKKPQMDKIEKNQGRW